MLAWVLDLDFAGSDLTAVAPVPVGNSMLVLMTTLALALILLGGT